MLISIIGPRCSGKKTLAKYLIENERFGLISIDPSQSTPLTSTTATTNQHQQEVICQSPAEMLDHVTKHWQQKFVTMDLTTQEHLNVGFDKRPFFLLITLIAPVSIRWKRQCDRSEAQNQEPPSLETFLLEDDLEIYGSNSSTSSPSPIPALNGISDLSIANHTNSEESTSKPSLSQASSLLSPSPPLSISSLSILNSHSTLSFFHSHLSSLSLSSTHRLRPSWDTYFILLCSLASQRSNCMKRRVGALLIRNNRVLSTGYNGTPRGLKNCNEGGCGRCNDSSNSLGEKLDECLCLHAEENALLECGRGGGGAEGAVLYCNTCPCLRCAVKIVQTGVKEVIYQLEYSVDDRTKKIFDESGVRFRRYVPSV